MLKGRVSTTADAKGYLAHLDDALGVVTKHWYLMTWNDNVLVIHVSRINSLLVLVLLLDLLTIRKIQNITNP